MNHRAHFFYKGIQLEEFFPQLNSTSLNLGEVQHLVDHAQQMPATAVDDGNLILLLSSSVLVLGDQPGEAEDGVARSVIELRREYKTVGVARVAVDVLAIPV